MKLQDALEQLDTLAQVAERTNRFDGFRRTPIAASGLIGGLAGFLQAGTIGTNELLLSDYIRYWVAAAAVSVAIILLEMLWRYTTSPTVRMKRMTLEVMKRLLPTFAAGSGVTLVIALKANDAAWMLPGLWSILMSLGVFSVAAMLHPLVQWAGVWYLTSGVVVLWLSRGEYALHPFTMAIPFGSDNSLPPAWSSPPNRKPRRKLSSLFFRVISLRHSATATNHEQSRQSSAQRRRFRRPFCVRRTRSGHPREGAIGSSHFFGRRTRWTHLWRTQAIV